MDKVSIIVPVYNCQKFLKHAVHSAQNQLYPEWEMLIVDDASTDASYAEALRLASEDSRIKVFHQPENKGVSACRNLAISQAEGRFLAFLDADDLWSREKLSKQLTFMKNNDYALSHTSYAFINSRGNVMSLGKVSVDEYVDLPRYMKTTQIGLSSVMIDRKKIPNPIFPDDKRLCEDARVWMHFMRKGEAFHGLDEVLTLYRIRANQLSGNKFNMAQNTLRRYWKEKNLPAYKRLYYFLNYAVHGVEKRINPPKLDITKIKQNFNCNNEI